jgi:DNA-directed RNA polymerase II subunit RPB1
MRGVSANVMCGQPGYYGTNSFGLVLDMKAVEKMNDAEMTRGNTNDKIDSLFNEMGLMAEKCSMKNIRVDNNVHNLKAADMGSCGDDGYNVF